MKTLFIREISSFFSSLTGYLVLIVFLIVNGLFLWVFPGEMNISDSGYASLDTLFTISPWVFLFLVPAITMRSFADERKSGNLDLLLTRPLTEMHIIVSKYLANLCVAVIALIPTLFYYISIILLSGKNIVDHGAIMGSYFGLVLLAAIYTSIGIFSSTLTENTVVAFIIAVLLCFLLYSGFGSIAYLSKEGATGSLIAGLGIEFHYNSMRKGVIDSRDLVYFLSVIAIFLLFSKIRLNSRKW